MPPCAPVHCSFKPLGHPGRRFGRGFVIAAAVWTALHILNITLQVKPGP